MMPEAATLAPRESAMDLVTQYKTLAQYNTRMNRSIYTVCESLSDEERKRDLHAFFGSVHRTLNHLLLADRLQLGRFIGPDHTQSLDESGKAIDVRSLNQQLYANFDELWRERQKTDAQIQTWAGTLTPELLAREVEYTAMSSPGRYRVSIWVMVTHFFNHQTHHRGQVTAMLSQLGRDVGVTDFMAMFRESI
jgi:uncharacterized damage-inducible protein DinB